MHFLDTELQLSLRDARQMFQRWWRVVVAVCLPWIIFSIVVLFEAEPGKIATLSSILVGSASVLLFRLPAVQRVLAALIYLPLLFWLIVGYAGIYFTILELI